MTGILILAAGGSTRFGSPKQLAEISGKPMLRHAVDSALAAGLGPVRVVLGAAADACREILSGLPVETVENPAWANGMGGSIKSGLTDWPGHEASGVIIHLGDQPGVTAGHLKALEAAAGSDLIVASRYESQLGVPAWFSTRIFQKLRQMPDHPGAKAIIASETGVSWIDLPTAALDVDTPADLAAFSRDLAYSTSRASHSEYPGRQAVLSLQP